MNPRSSSRPTPGKPPGNAEKNFCSVSLLLRLTQYHRIRERESGEAGNFGYLFGGTPQRGTKTDCHKEAQKSTKNSLCALCAFLWHNSYLLLWLKLDDSAAHTDRDRLSPIGSSELLHDVFHVDLNGFFRDEEFFRDVSIALAFGDFSKHLNFSLG